MKVLSLFGGIECGMVALQRLGVRIDAYYSSEVDTYAMAITKKNYPEIIHIGGVKEVAYIPERKLLCGSEDNVFTDIDIIIGGPPCQDLSIAKAGGKGLEGEKSSLFYEYTRILREVKPKYFLMENVASMKKEEKEKITKELLSIYPDTVCYMFNSNKVSAQNRKRLYWTNIQGITEPEDKGILLKDILEDIPFDDPRWKPLPEKYITEEFLKRTENVQGGACLTESRTEEAKEIRRKAMKEEGKDFCPRRGKTLLPRTDNKGNCITTGTTQETMVVYKVRIPEATKIGYIEPQDGDCVDLECEGSRTRRGRLMREKSNSLIKDSKFYCIRQIPRGKNTGGVHTEKAPTVSVKSYEHNNLVVGQVLISEVFVYRKLTPKECERLQTLPDDYTMGVSDSRRYKAIGNGWTVDIISHILSFLGKNI